MDPIAVLISSYKEGALIQGAIRSARACQPNFLAVFDGPTRDEEIPGDDTEPGTAFHLYVDQWTDGEWPSEHEKRTAMVVAAREYLYTPSFWILTLDADEILVWGEFLRDWLQALRPEQGELVVPIKRTEAAWDPESGFVSDISPSRLLHSSLVDRYLVSCWQIETPSGQVFEASHYRAPRQPMYGEPHIHHRHYLRRYERARVREHKVEEAEYTAGLREIGEVIPSPEDIERSIFPE